MRPLTTSLRTVFISVSILLVVAPTCLAEDAMEYKTDNSETQLEVPGSNSYTLYFEVDYQSVAGGHYQYGPEFAVNNDATEFARPKRSLNGGFIGLEVFYPLDLEFTLKNGQIISRSIDIPELIKRLNEAHEIPNLKNTAKRGSASIMVDINDERIKFEYVLFENQRGPNGEFFFKRQTFPMTELLI